MSKVFALANAVWNPSSDHAKNLGFINIPLTNASYMLSVQQELLLVLFAACTCFCLQHDEATAIRDFKHIIPDRLIRQPQINQATMTIVFSTTCYPTTHQYSNRQSFMFVKSYFVVGIHKASSYYSFSGHMFCPSSYFLHGLIL